MSLLNRSLTAFIISGPLMFFVLIMDTYRYLFMFGHDKHHPMWYVTGCSMVCKGVNIDIRVFFP
jgi:predicted signal transduction protein with EAL and GGDEF domain